MTIVSAVAEAHAKVIITGEHFVVHGACALAAAVNLRVSAEVWKQDELVVEASRGGEQRTPDVSPVRKMIDALYWERSEKPAVHVKLTSDVPSGAGLGSSAAAMVATVAALSRLEGWELDLGSIIESAMVGEREVHGRPSGVDVNVSTLGGVILFRPGEAPRKVILPSPVNLLIVFSGEIRNTGKLINRVSANKIRTPKTFARLCEAVSMLSEEASMRLVESDLEELGKIITLNHALLDRVGASNKELDDIVENCLSLGCTGAKLTGAGGGGCVLALPPRREAEQLRRQLSESGYKCFLATIPSEGVRSWTKEE